MTLAPSGNVVLHPLPYAADLARWFACLRHLPLPAVLASGDSSHGAARFDILVAAPHTILRTAGGTTQVSRRLAGSASAYDNTHETGDPIAVLARHCPIGGRALPDLPFSGGALGYFGYELLHEDFGIARTKAALPLPDMLVGIYPWALVLDHQLHKATLVCRDMDAASQQQVLALLQQAPANTVSAAFRLDGPFTSNVTRDQYLQQFRRIIDYIHAGDCYQVNLAQCFTAPCAGDPWQGFLNLQQHANAPFAAYLQDGDQAVLSFSPERFLRVSDGEVLTQPIKGTRPRSSDPAQDTANRTDLETSRKDRAENLMIVDLLRNDLGHVCATGSVSVESLFETQSFTNVHHLVSTIRGRLAQPGDVFRLIAASFPGGSITGTPKKRAMEIIDELEQHPRSVYCGAIGYLDHSGDMDSNICIRTLVHHGNQIHCWGGGGIVADSEGAAEYQETFDKISMFINNL